MTRFAVTVAVIITMVLTSWVTTKVIHVTAQDIYAGHQKDFEEIVRSEVKKVLDGQEGLRKSLSLKSTKDHEPDTIRYVP